MGTHIARLCHLLDFGPLYLQVHSDLPCLYDCTVIILRFRNAVHTSCSADPCHYRSSCDSVLEVCVRHEYELCICECLNGACAPVMQMGNTESSQLGGSSTQEGDAAELWCFCPLTGHWDHYCILLESFLCCNSIM